MSLIKPGPRKGPQGVTVQDNTPALSHQKKPQILSTILGSLRGILIIIMVYCNSHITV